MTNSCPRCHQPLKRSSNGGGISAGMPEGTVVLYCGNCRQATVDGSGRWVDVGPGFRESLSLLAGGVKQETDARQEAMTSDWSDPRWEQIGEWM
jgi:hypothetical protein